MPQLLQTTFPYTATLSGLAMMPGGLAMLVVMPLAGQVTGRFQPKYLMMIGLIGIVLSMWYSTTLTPDASFDYFAWVRVYQMVGLPFLFIPINTVAYDELPPDQTNQASALMNVARNPRFEAFHTVDVVGLMASGLCFGVALALILRVLRVGQFK